MVNEYSEAAVEVIDILNNTNQVDVKKIPQSFIKFLTNIASTNYKAEFNHNKKISDLKLKKETKEILGFIYITWWSDEKEREKYKQEIKTNKIDKVETKENYDLDDIFKTKKNKQNDDIIEKEEQVNMVEYKKENLLKSFFNKLLSFLGIKK